MVAGDGGNTGAPECSLCMEEYLDEGTHVPRNLNCGHTFCTGQWSCVGVTSGASGHASKWLCVCGVWSVEWRVCAIYTSPAYAYVCV